MPDVAATHASFRIPGETAASPLSCDDMAELMRCWRGAGVWLSVWDPHGLPIDTDAQGPAVWVTLWSRSSLTRDAVAAAVRSVLAGGAAAPAGPWGATLGLLCVPIHQRGRTAGVVAAGWVRGPAGEDFIRLCDLSQLDVTLMSRMVASVAAHPDAQAREFRPLLELTLRQAGRIQADAAQISSFTRALSDTYEELNLIYGISAALPLTQPPIAAIARLADDVLTVTHTDGLFFVFDDEENSTFSFGDIPRDPDTLRRIVGDLGLSRPRDRAGPEPIDHPPSDDGSHARPPPGAPPPAASPAHVIRNRIEEYPALRWAGDFARHMVGFPMQHNGAQFGTMVAVNQRRHAEFTSIQVKFLRAVADRLTGFLEKKRLFDDLADLLMGMIHAFIAAIDAKDPYTCGHSERVAFLSRLLAQRAGLDAAQCERVYLSGLLHDVGKIGVPDAILCKPGRLTEEEFDALRRHCEIGAKILAPIRQVQDLLPGVLHHHERLDGRGYPHRLAGHEVPLLGRIICLADCFDAMTSNRTYRAAMPIEAAMAEVRRCAGTQFDPMLAEKLLELDLVEIMRSIRNPQTVLNEGGAVVPRLRENNRPCVPSGGGA